jgi:hypothetical protein
MKEYIDSMTSVTREYMDLVFIDDLDKNFLEKNFREIASYKEINLNE